MSIFDTLQKFMEMGQDPRLMDSAENIGKAAHEIPNALAALLIEAKATNANLGFVINELQGMRMDLDRLADPVKRPPFSAYDVQAAMDGRWPEEAPIDPNDMYTIQGGKEAIRTYPSVEKVTDGTQTT